MKIKIQLLVAGMMCMSLCQAQTNTKKSLNELLDPENSGWTKINQWISQARNTVEVLPCDKACAGEVLRKSQLSNATPLGGVIYNTGGILIDHGWIRILGSGCNRLERSITDWNAGKAFMNGTVSSYMLVADDVLGGFYAIKAGSPEEMNSGKVFYFGPNGLTWSNTGLTYTGFLGFCISGNLNDFYEGFRWTGWERDLTKMNCNNVVSCYPLLWTKEAIQMNQNRKVIPVQKQWELYSSMLKCEKDPKLPVTKVASQKQNTGGKNLTARNSGK